MVFLEGEKNYRKDRYQDVRQHLRSDLVVTFILFNAVVTLVPLGAEVAFKV